MPSFPSPKTVSYFNDLDFFKDFENEFPAIVYNDALTSKLDFLTEPTTSPQRIDEFDLKDETSLSKCDEKEQNIWYDKDVHDLIFVETKFPAIVFNDNLTLNETLSCEPTVSSLNDNKIDFRISFDESDDEDYTIVFDKNSFSYKIISTNDLKTDSESHNMPLFASPEPSVSCIDNLDFFKEFENEFPVIVYNDALTSKSNFSTEPILCHQHIDKFDLKDETSLSEYSDNDNDKIDIEQSSGNLSVKPLPDVINTDVGAYAQGSNKLLETKKWISSKRQKTKPNVKTEHGRKDCAESRQSPPKNVKVSVQYEESASQTGAGLKEYCWMQS
ncbi:hypothetical protein Tco_0313835 [Tanacetum coccineum]